MSEHEIFAFQGLLAFAGRKEQEDKSSFARASQSPIGRLRGGVGRDWGGSAQTVSLGVKARRGEMGVLSEPTSPPCRGVGTLSARTPW